MKKACIILIVAALFSACVPVTYDVFAKITGTVIDAQTSDVVSGAYISLSPTGKSVTTGFDGYFEFLNLEPQQYTLTVQKDGYNTNRKTINATAGETQNVSITLTKIN